MKKIINFLNDAFFVLFIFFGLVSIVLLIIFAILLVWEYEYYILLKLATSCFLLFVFTLILFVVFDEINI